MKANYRFFVAAAVLGLLMTGPFTVTSVLVWLDMKEAERNLLTELLLSRLPIGTMMTMIGFALGCGVLHKLFKQYVAGLLGMSEHMRLMLGANRNFRVTPWGPPEVQQLARAVNDLAQQRDELLDNVEVQIAQAKASVEEEKNRLAALMSELAQAVVVCNLDGRILLYNKRARLQFKALSQGPTSMAGGTMIGLGRSMFSILEMSQVDHAREVIAHRLKSGKVPMANFITTIRGEQMLRVQMVPVMAAGGETRSEINGYVLTFDNITHTLEQAARRDQVMLTLTEGTRSALGNVRAAVTNLVDYPDMDAELRDRFLHVVADEVSAMSHRLDSTLHEFADSMKQRWPLEDVLGIDIITAASARIGDKLALPCKTEEVDDTLWIRADSYSLVFALMFIAAKLQDAYDIREVRLRLSREDNLAYLDLLWSGLAMSSETFYSLELENMQVGSDNAMLNLRDVINRHSGEIWFQKEKAAHRAYVRFVLPVAMPGEGAESDGRAREADRPEFYDFDLFAMMDNSTVDRDRKLSELAYTVFDTETTGLKPSEGDEIIQVGAARIINGRLLRQETFDQLVDPERSLNPASIAIHGITEDMVRGQPNIDVVLPAFHDFCEDTVLIGHNAAFDMRFLQLKEARTGIRFTQPVLDTLLLSAVAHPNQESHKLESIMERLGIEIDTRHNALEDALATGEVFLKLIPLLAEQGIETLGQALDAAEKTYYARIKY